MTDMHPSFPNIALSVRQPWAWAIIFGGKDVENRSWQAVNHGLKCRGRVAVHASAGMTKSEYEDAAEFMASIGVDCPPAIDLWRGGIVGSVEVTDVVSESDSKWFFGPRGLMLANPEPSIFVRVRGQLGYFNWRNNWINEPTPEFLNPAKWMRPNAPEIQSRDSMKSPQMDFLTDSKLDLKK